MKFIVLNLLNGETPVKIYVNMNDIVQFHETTLGSIVYTRAEKLQVIEKPEDILKQFQLLNLTSGLKPVY